MTSRMDIDEGQRITTNKQNNLTLEESIEFIDFLLRNDVVFGDADTLRLEYVKRWFEEGKIEGSLKREAIVPIFNDYKFRESAFEASTNGKIDKTKRIQDRMDDVKRLGKNVDETSYYNTLAGLISYSQLIYGL